MAVPHTRAELADSALRRVGGRRLVELRGSHRGQRRRRGGERGVESVALQGEGGLEGSDDMVSGKPQRKKEQQDTQQCTGRSGTKRNWRRGQRNNAPVGHKEDTDEEDKTPDTTQKGATGQTRQCTSRHKEE